MIKLVVFDIDGTLAELNKPIPNHVIENLKDLQRSGLRLCLSSGKPAAYISGLCRQLGLDDIIVIGENGSSIMMSAAFPPVEDIELFDSNMYKTKQALETRIPQSILDDVWVQPNKINLTYFYKDQQTKSRIDLALEEIFQKFEKRSDLYVFKHSDSIEFVFRNLNKGNALKYLSKHLSISLEDMVTVGDSINDEAMFQVVEHSIGINLQEELDVKHKVRTIEEALKLIEDLKTTII